MINRQRRRSWTLAALFACLGVSLFCVAYPMYVIRPFRTQGASELSAALVVMYIRPFLTILSALIALGRPSSTGGFSPSAGAAC